MNAPPGRLVVVLVVLAAGCSGLASPGPDGAGETLTPAPVPNARETPEGLPPGVALAGVVDAPALAGAHVGHLRDASFTLVAGRTVRDANGSIRSSLRVRVALAGNGSSLATARTAGPGAPVFLGEPPARATYWSNGTVYLRRFTRGNITTYNAFQPPNRGIATPGYWVRTVPFGGAAGDPEMYFGSLFAQVPTRVAHRSPGNGTVVVVNDASLPRSPTPQFAQEVKAVRNVTLDARIDGRGIVRSLRLVYDGEVGGRTVRVRRTLRYTRIGATTAPPPAWAGAALGDQPRTDSPAV